MKAASSRCLGTLAAWDHQNPSSRLQVPWPIQGMFIQSINKGTGHLTSTSPLSNLESQLIEAKDLLFHP